MAKKITVKTFMKELNIGFRNIEEFLKEQGYEGTVKPPTKLEGQWLELLLDKFDKNGVIRAKIAESAEQKAAPQTAEVKVETPAPEKTTTETREEKGGLKILGKIDLDKKPKKKKKEKPAPEPAEAKEEKTAPQPKNQPEAQPQTEETLTQEPQEKTPEKTQAGEIVEAKEEKEPSKPGLKILGKIELPEESSPSKSKKSEEKPKEKAEGEKKKKRRKRIRRPVKKAEPKPAETPSDEEIKRQIRETLERLQGKQQKKKFKRLKREKKREKLQKLIEEEKRQETILKVAEFITVSELAGLMGIEPNDLIATGFQELGLMLTPNTRLEGETIQLLADEYGYEVQFADVEEIEEVEEEVEDDPSKLKPRPPVVTIMGHVDHGKTSLLDYIRKTNIVAGEAGGITQHIGAYNVTLPDGQRITFLDTPGHEAFTAMRARGAQVTDIAVIVIAADDKVNQQTKEAINHAAAAGVPIIFAINKIDKPNADPERIKNELAQMNYLVEDWGGKYQSQDISAKTGQGVEDLLEKILLEAELMELKANPDRPASGTVLEASLEKGKGYTANVLVQNGTLKVGDYVVAGRNHGKVRAMFDERGNRVKEAGPSTPVKIIGLDGAPRAGDKFKVYLDEKEAKKIAQKRDQIYREQQLHARRHITLDELGRRLAMGDFKQLNLIIKGDVDGSVEALSDALTKLSNEKVEVRIIHKGVGQITEADVNLAAASDAIIIGFNVRPSGSAARLAHEEGVQIKTYSIIYDVIDDVKNAIENMLSPVEREEVTGTAEVRQTFKISRVGTVAGCMVTDGKIHNKSRVRVIRDGIVIHEGELSSLKRFKDDVKEVTKGYECGLTIKNFNDIKEGDIIEAFDVIVERQKL
ncbi:MAG: translation initiation factor IF-2 [Chlorobi bacterium]|nr:translation initiation factor IF-2 [Chlorobiota bacterium]